MLIPPIRGQTFRRCGLAICVLVSEPHRLQAGTMREKDIANIANWRTALSVTQEHGPRAQFVTLGKAVEALRDGNRSACREWIEVSRIVARKRFRKAARR